MGQRCPSRAPATPDHMIGIRACGRRLSPSRWIGLLEASGSIPMAARPLSVQGRTLEVCSPSLSPLPGSRRSVTRVASPGRGLGGDGRGSGQAACTGDTRPSVNRCVYLGRVEPNTLDPNEAPPIGSFRTRSEGIRSRCTAGVRIPLLNYRSRDPPSDVFLACLSRLEHRRYDGHPQRDGIRTWSSSCGRSAVERPSEPTWLVVPAPSEQSSAPRLSAVGLGG
jgi:hypothetical protein